MAEASGSGQQGFGRPNRSTRGGGRRGVAQAKSPTSNPVPTSAGGPTKLSAILIIMFPIWMMPGNTCTFS